MANPALKRDAAVTYGNGKSTSFVAFSMAGKKAVVIEIKSTSAPNLPKPEAPGHKRHE